MTSSEEILYKGILGCQDNIAKLESKTKELTEKIEKYEVRIHDLESKADQICKLNDKVKHLEKVISLLLSSGLYKMLDDDCCKDNGHTFGEWKYGEWWDKNRNKSKTCSVCGYTKSKPQ